MQHYPQFAFDHYVVRTAGLEDVPAIVDMTVRNRDILAPLEPVRQESYYSAEHWMVVLTQARSAFNDRRSALFWLFDRDSQRALGKIGISNVVGDPFHAAFLGYSLSQEQWGQGLMRRSLEVTIQFLFDEWNLHRLMANYMPENERSGRLLRRLGFTVEGYARDYLRINGEWRDHVLTSLHKPDWQAR
ncbi:GNAT family N-acetyltransferase [Parachitinimonas caeni]|uniref:GNAT family N-acetyltransferase n=1 Tax=Parachitinimonas caeni TaxID=3031301 RepID=A0ABT7DTB6_9NEIS|nr:GNAT family N-acetyltransferase [Parachitinimonas caeni]MDK2123039.1 GNAT family N-acetyltransferase [Parachitinimonas caeni]